MLNLKRLLTGDFNRLRYIQRFGTALTLHRENVAEHSYYVGLYAFFISEWVKLNTDIKLDALRIHEACLFHDVEEVRTGDFPRPFKYRRPELRLALEEAAGEEFEDIVRDVLPDVMLSVRLRERWDTAKDTNDPEGAIVSLADFLSVVSHLWQELNSSNASMNDHYETVVDYLHTFRKPCFDFIRPLVEETENITMSVFKKSKEERLDG